MSRRSFLFMGGVALAGAVIASSVPVIHTPGASWVDERRRRLTIFREILNGIQANPQADPYAAGEAVYQRLLAENRVNPRGYSAYYVDVDYSS